MISPTTQKVIKQFEKANLSLEDRTALITVLLSKLHTLPLNDTFIISQNSVIINGKPLEPEQLIVFRDSCISLKDNFAFKVLSEQVRYLSTNLGVYKSISQDELFFYKAALWTLQQYDDLLDKVV